MLSTENKSPSMTPKSIYENSSIVYTTSSPFKVKSPGNDLPFVPNVHQEIVLSKHLGKDGP